MRIERDDVVHAHAVEFLQHQRAVQAFAGAAAVLTAAVEQRHDNGDALRLAANGCNGALQVHVVVIGGHRHFMPVHVVGAVVRTDIAEDVEIQSANGILNQSLAFAVTEARAGCAHEEVLATHTWRCGHIARQGFFRVLAPLQQPLVHLVAHVLRAAHGNQAQRSNRRRQKGFLIPGTHKVRHRPSTSFRHVSFRGVCVEPPRGGKPLCSNSLEPSVPLLIIQHFFALCKGILQKKRTKSCISIKWL